MLRATPGSHRDWMRAFFAEQGIAESWLDFAGHSPLPLAVAVACRMSLASR